VFNYADVAIDISIVWLLVMFYLYPEKNEA
jgi:lipoprotein signal peptidase